MLSLLPIAALGFVLGVRHATDPDHVIAVGTIVTRERTIRGAALVGVLWGLGHTATILLAGGAIVFFGLVVPARVGLTMELSVALMLIGLGAWSLRAAARPPADGIPLGRLDRRFGGLGVYQAARPFVMGVVHGLAGSASVSLLVVATIHEPLLSLAYLVVFGLGTIAGMMLITAALALPLAHSARNLLGVNRSLALAAGLLSVGFGLVLVYQIGFVDGLFTVRG
ncbi:MAG TPA: high-affinity nickel-transport family protein [Methylomirabilota bacterium]|nr:high-affinity nickel-transport family protein [Methylomirabilota bacterium]